MRMYYNIAAIGATYACCRARQRLGAIRHITPNPEICNFWGSIQHRTRRFSILELILASGLCISWNFCETFCFLTNLRDIRNICMSIFAKFTHVSQNYSASGLCILWNFNKTFCFLTSVRNIRMSIFASLLTCLTFSQSQGVVRPIYHS